MTLKLFIFRELDTGIARDKRVFSSTRIAEMKADTSTSSIILKMVQTGILCENPARQYAKSRYHFTMTIFYGKKNAISEIGKISGEESKKRPECFKIQNLAVLFLTRNSGK